MVVERLAGYSMQVVVEQLVGEQVVVEKLVGEEVVVERLVGGKWL